MIWPSKKLSNKFLGLYDPCTPGTIQSLSDFRTVPCCTPSFPVSMLEPATPNLIPITFNPTPTNIVDDKLDSKSPKSSTPRLTTNVMPAGYCIFSIGQGMRALMKKLLDPHSKLGHGSELVADFHSAYQPSLVLFQSLTQAHFTSIWSLIWSFKHFYKSIQSYYYSTLS